MYSFIKGYIDSIDDNTVVLNCNDIGYEIFASSNTVAAVCNEDSIVKLYTYLKISEDEMSLYGFHTKDEKNLFLELISVSGVGCKLAISILSGISNNDLILAIINGDIKTMSKIKGVGKKTAERIIVELKDKLGAGMVTSSFDSGYSIENTLNAGSNLNDAVNILVSLGFSKTEANAAVIKASKMTDEIDKIVELALKNSMRL